MPPPGGNVCRFGPVRGLRVEGPEADHLLCSARRLRPGFISLSLMPLARSLFAVLDAIWELIPNRRATSAQLLAFRHAATKSVWFQVLVTP